MTGKLFERLNLLSADELKSFEHWLRSPWCNSNKKLLLLFRVLKNYYPEFNSPVLQKEYLFEQLYPAKKFNDRMLRNQMGALSMQVNRFLVLSRFEQEKNLFHQLLIKTYIERDKTEWAIKEAGKVLNHSNDLEVEGLLAQYLVNEGLYHQPNTVFRQRKNAQPIFQANEKLDLFYWLSKLRLLNEMEERKKRLKDRDEKFTRPPWIAELPPTPDLPAIAIYKDRLLQQKKPLREKYEFLKERYFESLDKLSEKDQKILLIYLINEGSRLFQEGNAEILEELFAFYQFGINKSLLLHNNRMTESTYLNIISVGNMLKAFVYIKQFIANYTAYLPLPVQRDGEKWAKAQTYYHMGQYQKCIAEIKDYKFAELVFVYRARIVLLQAYFDCFLQDDSYFDLLLSNTKSFKAQVEKDKRLSDQRCKALIHFIQYIKRLTQWVYDINPSMPKLERIMADLKLEDNIQGVSWLEQKIAEIKKNCLDRSQGSNITR